MLVQEVEAAGHVEREGAPLVVPLQLVPRVSAQSRPHVPALPHTADPLSTPSNPNVRLVAYAQELNFEGMQAIFEQVCKCGAHLHEFKDQHWRADAEPCAMKHKIETDGMRGQIGQG